MFRVIAYKTDYFSVFYAAKRESALISVSIFLFATTIIFPCCGSQREKMVGVVAYNAGKRSILLATMWKMF
jgi:hypothetical protein